MQSNQENRKYAVLILTHGRADNVVTYDTLRRGGYKGPIYLVIDDEDDQRDRYEAKYGKDSVIVFSKAAAAEYTDTADTVKERNVVVFARNTCHKIAADLGLTHFIEVDDDYSWLAYRYGSDGHLRGAFINDLEPLFDAMFDFLDVSGALAVCPAQGGDYIGGAAGVIWKNKLHRKAMNLYFCRTDRPFQFYGRINEDTTAYTYLGQKGKLFFTVADWCLMQAVTQQNKGGLTEAYLDLGTYVKSFYSVMYSPSCVRISSLGDSGNGKGVPISSDKYTGQGNCVRHERIHHKVLWGHCTPMILSEAYRKPRPES